jgi:zinc resistance-associated protein
MKKRIITTVAVLALVSLSAFAFAAPRGGRGPAAQPALTPEKQAAVSKIVDKHHAKLYELREKIWAKHTELQALSQSGKAERSDIQSLVADIAKLRATMNQERDAMRAEIEKETGITGYGRGYHRGGGMGGGYGPDGCGAGGGMGGGMGGMMGGAGCPGGACN